MPSSLDSLGPAPAVAGSRAPGPTVGAVPIAPAGVTALELPELTAGATRHVVRSQPLEPAPFLATDEPTAAPVFEVRASGGVPEQLLAPARAAAQAAGYAAGWAHGVRAARLIADAEAHVAAAGRDKAEAQRDADVQRAITALDAAATAVEQRSAPTAHEIEDLIVSSALTIAEALIGTCLRDDAVRGQAALTRALALAPADEDVTVALSPADFALVDGSTVEADLTRRITLVEDASLAPGDATASCGATSIDARISSGLARVREVLQ